MKFPSYLSLHTFFVMAIWGLLNIQQVHAQAGIELENVQALIRFGEQITFIATIESASPLQAVEIMISDVSSGMTQVEPITLGPEGRTEYRFDTTQNPLRPFTNVTWKYQFTFPDGSTTQSQSFAVRYADDRFNWQTVETGSLRVHWYEEGTSFGQAALEAAQAGLESIRNLLPLDLAQPIEIFVYANVKDLGGTLMPGGADWLAGHADPALGIVMVVVEPGTEQNITMEQRIPHELMHIMLYRRIGAGYDRIPVWLREGMATLVELYPNPDYERVLAEAVAGNRLIPLRDLCTSFPADRGQAFLAYAESRSFTHYLHETYGLTGLLDLSAAYADGVDCERGTERVSGMPLSRLEAEWHSSLSGQNAFLPILQNLSPYLVLLCLVLAIPLIGMATALRKKGNRNEPETFVRKR